MTPEQPAPCVETLMDEHRGVRESHVMDGCYVGQPKAKAAIEGGAPRDAPADLALIDAGGGR
jgi:hypothetical protein